MVNAFTTGFRVTQVQAAISKVLPDSTGVAAALESAQVVALAILVREQMDPAQFAAIYRPFATVLPGPEYRPPGPIDQQIAGFLRRLPTLKGEVEAEVSAVAKALTERPKAQATSAGPAVAAIGAQTGLDPAANYTAAWKQVIAAVSQTASFTILPPTARKGDYIELRAEMNVLAAVSACPADRNATNDGRAKPLGITILA